MGLGVKEREISILVVSSAPCAKRRVAAQQGRGGDLHPSGEQSRGGEGILGQKKEDAANANGKPPAKKQSPGELRLHKDIAELNLPKSTRISFPNGKDDLMNFEVTIRPDEGYYVGGKFIFTFQVPPAYPHEPPKVKCKTKVYHPNIDLEGNVCLNILREDWKPVLNVNTIQPNDEDPLNHEAAAVLRDNPEKFERNVQRAMAGGYVGETHFPRCM
uniref:UBC core domain-containing protein n=1 Tax=Oryza barthii TaxID=65489 RepID=A0A0D3GZL8_9ORYZ